ncbi:MAG TPA: hypothetical protein VIH25_11360 [Steroidobacteraceae bacterium]
MDMSNLAVLLDALEPQACVSAAATEPRCALFETDESPLNSDAIEVPMATPPQALARRRKRRRLIRFRDNFSGDFAAFRIR